jgi:hypothetical protein
MSATVAATDEEMVEKMSIETEMGLGRRMMICKTLLKGYSCDSGYDLLVFFSPGIQDSGD